MHVLNKIISIAGLICVVQTASAQQQEPVLSLAGLLSSVSSQAPSLIADSSAINIRRSIAEETKNNWLPSLKLSYQADLGTNNNVPGAYFGFGMVPSNTSGVRESNLSSDALSNLGIVTMDWEIYNFGGFKAQNKAAEADIKVSQQQYQLSKYQIQTYAIENYLKLFHYQNMISIQQENIRRNQQIRSSIQSLAKSGIIAGVDTSIAEAELSKSRLTLIELTNKFNQLQIQLAALSGISNTKIVADTTISRQLLALSLQMSDQHPASHPLIGYYESLYQSSKEKESLVRKSYLPKLMLEGAVWGRGSSITQSSEYGPLNNGWGMSRTNYLVGLGLSYNITDLRRQQLKLQTQKNTSVYEQKRLSAQKTDLDTEIRQADLELKTAIQRLNEIPHQLAASEAAYRQKYSLYKNGLINIIELDIALNLLYRAEADYATAKYTFCHAVFEKAITRNQVDQLITSLK